MSKFVLPIELKRKRIFTNLPTATYTHHPCFRKKIVLAKEFLNMNTMILPKQSSITSPKNTTVVDPIGVKIHTLKNGLTLYMSVNKNEPRIFTNIVVRAGSKQDPADTTGLAHYLEHMMFKGTSKIGALDWDKEQAFLSQIAELYEQYRQETDPSVRQSIYAKIDTLSNEAATLTAANEYDRLVAALGAKSTNAYTSNEQTVYVTDIPSNELEKWFQLESERFKMVVLRLFHTELETVYEEFNMGQDEDRRKVYEAMMSALFPTHPYGMQTTIGKGEHLKNPSHYNILKYFETYYVANNMAIVMSGDFEPAHALILAEKYFGSYENKPLPVFHCEKQPPLSKITKKEVIGQQAEMVQLAWRLGGVETTDPDLAGMLSVILNNDQAGLIDLNLVQKQLVLDANAGFMGFSDYSALVLSGRPREGQSLEEVEKLLVSQMDCLKKGEFPEWLMKAVIKDYKYSQVKGYEGNQNRVSSMTNAFVKGVEWEKYIGLIDRLKKVTKQDLMNFANTNFNENYVVVYKKTGEDKNVFKVEKPTITPVKPNKIDKSDFAQTFFEIQSPRLKPVFIDFNKAIKTISLKNGLPLDYVKNTTNKTFSLYYIVEIGRHTDRELALALNYLPFLGTDKYTAAELQQEFYKLGLSFEIFSNEDRSYVVLNGLEESFTEGVKLFEHILKNVKADEQAYKNMVSDMLSKRENDKKNKRVILQNALFCYAKYGEKSPFTHNLSKVDLEQLNPEILIEKIKSLTDYEHRIFYYGTQELGNIAIKLNNLHKTPNTLKASLPVKNFTELETIEKKVLFVHYPTVQMEILMLSKGTPQYDVAESIMASFYNNYFGSGLSSIVFQEIREARALAYSANAYHTSPSRAEKAHYYQAYVSTQAEKIKEALNAMQDIINNMPVNESQIEEARLAVLKSVESERYTKATPYWAYRNSLDRGIETDIRETLYNTISTATLADLKDFQETKVKGRNFNFLVMGDKSKVDFNYLQTIGEVKEVSLEEIFGY
jgi:zinc protease